MYLVRLDTIVMQKMPQSVVSPYELTTLRYAPNFMTLIVQEYGTLSTLVIYNATSIENSTSHMDSNKHCLLLFQHNLGVGRERIHIGISSQNIRFVVNVRTIVCLHISNVPLDYSDSSWA